MKGYTMPFLWIANNDYEAIGREIEKIRESGSETFCVESRTHSDFCRPRWWEVMDFIVKKADSLSMRVWLLDDKHYPTGFANGAVERFPALRQRHIFSENRDLCGPALRAIQRNLFCGFLFRRAAFRKRHFRSKPQPYVLVRRECRDFRTFVSVEGFPDKRTCGARGRF